MKPFRFAEHRQRLQRILVIELLGLGDNVHLLPALHLLRAALPEARIEVMVRAHVGDLFVATPWIDRVWRYPVIPRKPTVGQHRELLAQLREARFDLVLNASSNDRSSLLTGLSRAPLRVGRVPRKGWLPHWRLLHSHYIEATYADRPMWRQKVDALLAAGVPDVEGPPFRVQRPSPQAVDARVLALESAPYLHVSPFASEDRRSLPDAQTAALLNRLARLAPAADLVVSMGPAAREARKWQAIERQLDFTPRAVFAGDLDTASFLRLISGARLHLGPDSGGVHIARMYAVPTVSLIRDFGGTREWIDDSPQSVALLSREHDAEGLRDIETEAVVQAVATVLSRR